MLATVPSPIGVKMRPSTCCASEQPHDINRRRENALNRGSLAGEEDSTADGGSAEQPANQVQAGSTSLFNVKPEQPQLKTEASTPATAPAPSKPELPKIPAPELPKSSLPDKPK